MNPILPWSKINHYMTDPLRGFPMVVEDFQKVFQSALNESLQLKVLVPTFLGYILGAIVVFITMNNKNDKAILFSTFSSLLLVFIYYHLLPYPHQYLVVLGYAFGLFCTYPQIESFRILQHYLSKSKKKRQIHHGKLKGV